MGTSQSSKGPKSKVRLIPSWVENPEVPPGAPPLPDDLSGQPIAEETSTDQVEPKVAQKARFAAARQHLGDFARSGDKAKLRAGVSSYVKSGHGGSRTAAQRMASTSATAGRLFNFLSALPVGARQGQLQQADPRLQPGRSARDIVDAIIEGVQPVNGTLDAEASRHAINDALSELLTQYPQADLLSLTADQLELVVELYVARDVFFHIELDVGEALRKQGVSALMLTDRLRQAQDYVKATVSGAFNDLRLQGRAITALSVQIVTQRALELTMEVFAKE